MVVSGRYAAADGNAGDCAYKCLSCTGTFDLGTCTALPAGSVCAAGACMDGVLTPPRQCNGAGSCMQVVSASCSPYTCRTDAPLCRTDCATPGDCAAGDTCVSGVCGLPRFGCGSTTCAAGQICVHEKGGVDGGPLEDHCYPLPDACAGVASCSCITSLSFRCGMTCQQTSERELACYGA